MKIVVLDGYGANPGDLSWAAFEELGELKVFPRTAPEDVLGNVGNAEVILTNKTMLDSATLKRLKSVKYVGVLATGYNIVDVEAARRQGIVVTNIPAYSTESVAQMTFAHILNITNRVDSYAQKNRQGRWCESNDFCYLDHTMPELYGKTLGIVGLGSIGSRVASIAHEFGLDVFAVTSKNPSDLPQFIRKTTIDGLFAVSDILSLHCPLNESTRAMINKDSLAKMRHGAILINTSRGQLVDEHDVADALDSGQLGAYGADVLSSEPPATDNPLLTRTNAFLTPHIAWATRQARARLMDIAVANVRAFISGNPVNVVSL